MPPGIGFSATLDLASAVLMLLTHEITVSCYMDVARDRDHEQKETAHWQRLESTSEDSLANEITLGDGRGLFRFYGETRFYRRGLNLIFSISGVTEPPCLWPLTALIAWMT